MISGQVGILSAIVIYLLAMVYVGFYFSKKGSGDSAVDLRRGQSLAEVQNHSGHRRVVVDHHDAGFGSNSG